MADSDNLALFTVSDTPKNHTLAEPSPVTHENVREICEAIVFTFPKTSKSANLIESMEDVIAREMKNGLYKPRDIKQLMDVEGNECRIRTDIQDRLRSYQEQRVKLFSRCKAMNLTKDATRDLEKTVQQIEDMCLILQPVEEALALVLKNAATTPLKALCAKINGRSQNLSLSDELKYMQMFKCQSMLLQLGTAMVHQRTTVEMLSKTICLRVFSNLSSLSAKPLGGPIGECQEFLAHYVSYMWNVSYLYRMTLRSIATSGEKNFLEFKAGALRHCMKELTHMSNASTAKSTQEAINVAQVALRISLNCVLMAHYYKEYDFRMAFRTYNRTFKLLDYSPHAWLDKYKLALDSEMTTQHQPALSSWSDDVDMEDDTGEFGRPMSIKLPA
jgi:hypothetical protein